MKNIEKKSRLSALIPESLLNEIDEYLKKKSILSRTQFLVWAIKEKLEKEVSKEDNQKEN